MSIKEMTTCFHSELLSPWADWQERSISEIQHSEKRGGASVVIHSNNRNCLNNVKSKLHLGLLDQERAT